MKKTYCIYASTTDYLKVNVLANNYDEAWELAHQYDGGDYECYDFDWEIDRVELVDAPKTRLIDLHQAANRLPKARLVVVPGKDKSGLRIIGQSRHTPNNNYYKDEIYWETESEWHKSIPELQKLLDKLPLVN